MATEAFRNRQKTKFLKTFKEIKTVYSTCEAIGIPRRTIYTWLKEDPEFKANFEDIRLGVGEELESIAFQLVNKMAEKEDYSKPVLLITMLNANLPGKYRSTDNTSEDSKQLMEDFRKMAAKKKRKPPKSKVVKEAEDIINDSDNK
jgi:hypothetical protein|tara:strand:- start:98 stop:535 length:438 start_codon:yes stop_codon:yes gene_type:complete